MRLPTPTSWLRCALSAVSRLGWPWAKAWAQRGYFGATPLGIAQTLHAPRPAPYATGGTSVAPTPYAIRIVIVACHWIGDTFWASQVVPILRERFPQAELFALSKPHCLDLWEGLLEPDHRIAAGEVVSDRRRERVSWRSIAGAARKIETDPAFAPFAKTGSVLEFPNGNTHGRDALATFDLVIDLTGNRYSALFTFLLRPRHSIGFDGNELGWLYSLNVEDAERPDTHLSHRPFRVIEPLIGAFALPEAPAPPRTRVDPQVLRAELGLTKDYVVLAPGAGWPAKQWPTGRFIRIREALNAAGLAVAAAGSAAEEALCRAVAGSSSENRVFAAQALSKVIALLQPARGFAGNDSGLGHLAAALGIPTAVVFTGATGPALCRPLGPCAHAFEAAVAPDDVVRCLLREAV